MYKLLINNWLNTISYIYTDLTPASLHRSWARYVLQLPDTVLSLSCSCRGPGPGWLSSSLSSSLSSPCPPSSSPWGSVRHWRVWRRSWRCWRRDTSHSLQMERLHCYADPSGKKTSVWDWKLTCFRTGDISTQTVFQYQKKQKKCKNLRSYGIASGSNALSYMSFVASVITLIININNNSEAHHQSALSVFPSLMLQRQLLSVPSREMRIRGGLWLLIIVNANNNNNNQVNINFGNNNNLVSNLNQNVGNNFNLMFPPGRRRRRETLRYKRITSLLLRDILDYSTFNSTENI